MSSSNQPRTKPAPFAGIRASVRKLLSPHRSAYRDYLGAQTEQTRVLGIDHPVRLDEIYVDVVLRPTAEDSPGHATVSIWDAVGAALTSGRNLLITGAAGSGKSALLQSVAGQVVRGSAPPAASDMLPLTLAFRDMEALVADFPEMPLEQVASTVLARAGTRVPAGWLADMLGDGQFLVLLDGLDDIASAARRDVLQRWAGRQAGRYRQVVFIVTGTMDPSILPDADEFEIVPLGQLGVRTFLENWYAARAAGRQPDRAGQLVDAIYATSRLAAAALNPMLLAMAATVFEQRTHVPERKVDLYEALADVVLERSVAGDGLSSEQARQVLETLAYAMMSRGLREIAAQEAHYDISEALRRLGSNRQSSDFLAAMALRAGLLVERELGVYAFVHMPVQQYLAAMHARRTDKTDELLARIGETWWRETIRLYAALGDGSQVVQACLVSAASSSDEALFQAVECYTAAIRVDLPVQTRLEDTFNGYVANSDDLRRRRVVAGARLQLRLDQLKRYDAYTFVDDSLVTQLEYWLFIDHEARRGVSRYPDHWTRSDIAPHAGREPVLGVRARDAEDFCAWLNARANGHWHFRLPRPDEFAAGSATTARMRETAGVGYWERSETGYTCRLLGRVAPASSPALLQRFLADDLAADLDSYRVLARDLGIDDMLESALAAARDISFDSVSNLNMGRAIDLDMILARARRAGIEVAVDLALASVLINARGRGRVLARRLARTATISRDLARVLRPEDLAPLAAKIADLKESRQIAEALLQSLADASPAVAPVRELAETLVLQLGKVADLEADVATLDDHSLPLPENPIFERLVNTAQVFGLGETSALTTARAILTTVEKCLAEMLRWYIRMRAIGHAAAIMSDEAGDASGATEAGNSNLYLDLYVDMVFLEERIRGNMPAFEGIRLVKSRTDVPAEMG
ncbi:MAG: NACHT domain-containing protein [Anaerolineales bacterium]